MRFLGVLLSSAVAILIALTAFAVPASAATPAPVPTWQVGQSVGYGTHLDVGALADTYLAAVRANPSAFNITSLNTLNVTGSVDAWTVDQVTQKTSGYYTLASQGAEGIKLHIAVNLTLNNLPRAGTYPGTPYGAYCAPPRVPLGSGPIAVLLDATILSTSSGTSHLQVSDLAYLTEVSNVTLQANIAFTGYHLPSESLNSTTCALTVSYANPSLTLTADTKNQVRMLFAPAWDYFNFPISDNKTWWANTTATTAGTLSGTINVQGLSSKDQKAFFDNLTKSFQSGGLTVTGLSAFPIDLAKVTVMAGPMYVVNHGVISDYPLPLKANNRAIASAVTLSDGNQHAVYLITDAAYRCPVSSTPGSVPFGYAAVYAPDFPAAGAGMIVGYQLVTCFGSASVAAFELKNTKPADAQQKIGQTQTTYQIVAPAQGNAFADFFLQTPYLGLILIAILVIAAVALLVMRRRRRPTMAPPGAETPAVPPPPPSPPPAGPGNP